MKETVIQKYDYIDSLKGFAILGIVLSHVSQWMVPPSDLIAGFALKGALGVQLFFLVSALTLSLSMERRNQTEPHPLKSFFIRRFFRIAPLFYLAILIYTLYYGLAPRFWAPNGIQWWFIPLTAAFLHGWHPETINSIVPGGSVIAIEATFYLLFPFLFSRLKNVKITLAFLAGSLILAKVLSMGITHLLSPFYSEYTSYLVDDFSIKWFFSQLPIFLTGILLYHFLRNNRDLRDKVLGLVLLVLSSLLLLAFYDIQTFKNLLSEHFLYGVAFGILAFALSVYPLGALVNPVTKAIGKLSYAIFLSHFGIIIIFRTIFPGGFPVQGDLGCFAAFAAIFAVSAGVAFLLYHLIEKLGTQIGRILIAKL